PRPGPAPSMASHLGGRPVLRLRSGMAERLALPRREAGPLPRIAREWRAGGGPTAQRTAVFHAARPERAAELSGRLRGVSFLAEFSPAMAIHTGPGVVGVAWLRAING